MLMHDDQGDLEELIKFEKENFFDIFVTVFLFLLVCIRARVYGWRDLLCNGVGMTMSSTRAAFSAYWRACVRLNIFKYECIVHRQIVLFI